MFKEKPSETKLKVQEALQEEAYKGIVRIDSQTMRQIGVRPGDIIEIEGGKITVGVVDRAYPTDIGQSIIRMDGILRRNAKTGIGELVKIRKAEVKEAKSVTIAPAQQGVMIQADPELFKRSLLGRPILKGDIIALGGTKSRRRTMTGSPFEDIFDVFEQGFMGGFGFGSLKFIVADTNPKEPVIITENTSLTVSSKAIEVSEDSKIFDVTYEDIGGLEDEVKKIREMVELPLKHPEIFERLGVEAPKGVLLHGPPGTGKTLLAKAVANETDSNFLLVNGPELTCVSGDTEVLTNPNGREKIENLFNEAYKTGELVVKDDRKEIIIPKNPIKVFSLNENFEIVPDTVKSLTRVKKDSTLRIQTKKKADLTISRNHPFATLDNEGNLKWVMAKDLKINDYVAMASHIKTNKNNPTIEWWKKLDQENTFVRMNGTQRRLKEVKDIKKIEGIKHAVLKSNIERAKFIKPIFKINPKLAEFIGLMLSEGYIGFDEVSITGENKELLDYYTTFFKELFGFTDDRVKIKYGRQGKTTVYSTILAEILTKGFGLPRNRKPKDSKLPNWLFKCNKETIAAFIKGYYYGDGNQAWLKERYPSPVVYSANKEVLKDMQILLLQLGIISKITSSKTGMGNILHALEILDSEGREKFYKLLKLDFKKEVFERWFATRIKKGSNETIPNIAPLLYKLKIDLGLKYNKEIPEINFEPIISGRFTLTFRNAKKLLSIFEENFKKIKHRLPRKKIEEIITQLSKLKRIISSDLKWDKITNIKQTGPKILYDLSMSKYSNFFAGSPLLLLHNSKFYGESEKRIRDVFQEAEKSAPSIIFIDEIDSIAPKREETYGEVERRMVSQLLTVMDGLKSRGKVVVIGASVTGDTPVMIKEEDGIKILPLGKFVDQYYKEGEENIEKKVDNIYTLGFNKTKVQNTFNQAYFDNSAFKKVRSVFRHRVNEIYEVEYVGGKIRTTGNHSVFVRTKQGLKYKPVALLKPGEVLVELPYKVNSNIQKIHEFPLTMSLELPVHNIPLIEKCYEQAINGTRTNLISVESGKHSSTVNRWKMGECIPDELTNAYHNLLPSSINVTPELMRLLGYYTAEGYTRKGEDKEVDFCFGTHEKELIRDLVTIMKRVFNVEPSNIKITDSRTNIIYNIKPLSNFFGRLCGKGAYNKYLPPFIFEAPREYFLEFLKGYLNGDGYEFDDGKLQITSVSEQIIIELNWLCRMHGIKSHISKTIAKAGRRIGDSIVSKRSIGYRVNIPKTSNPFIQNKVLNAKKARIKSITRLPYYDYVYDLCGCDNEAFFGGKTPILLHNTNRPNSLDPALRRPGRFDREVSIGVPNKKGRLNILKIHTRNMPLDKDVSLTRLSEITHGFVGADLSALCKEAAMNVLRRILPDINLKEDKEIPQELLNKLLITDVDFREALKLVRPSALREVLIETPNIKWDQVGGLEQLKQELREAVEWPLKNPEVFTKMGVRAPRGILMYGPPGTGKTLLAKAVASESEANFIYVKGPELISKWVGDSEKGIRKIFEKARQASPTIIFFDEIDAIAARRGGIDEGSRATERVVNQLLTEMDGLEEMTGVVVLAATNRPDMLDPGLLRPGRFDKILSTRVPDIRSREEIFKIHIKNMPLTPDVDIKELAKLTENYVGADIEGLCREAALIALRKNIKAKQISMEDFKEALEKTNPSIQEDELKRYKEIEEEYIRTARAAIQKVPSYLG